MTITLEGTLLGELCVSFAVPVRGFDDLWGQNGSCWSTLAGLALKCDFKDLLSSSTCG